MTSNFDREFSTVTKRGFWSRVYDLLQEVKKGKRMDELKANNFANLRLLYGRNYYHEESIAINDLNSISDIVGFKQEWRFLTDSQMKSVLGNFLSKFEVAKPDELESLILILKSEVKEGKHLEELKEREHSNLRSLYRMTFNLKPKEESKVKEYLDEISGIVGLKEKNNFGDLEFLVTKRDEETIIDALTSLPDKSSWKIIDELEFLHTMINRLENINFQVTDKIREDWKIDGVVHNKIKNTINETDATYFNNISECILGSNPPLESYTIEIEENEVEKLEVNEKPYIIHGKDKEGRIHGSFLEYWPGTQDLRFKGEYKNGRKNGIFKKYDRRGNVIHKLEYVNDEKNGNEWVIEKGTLKTFIQWKSGLMHGFRRLYTEQEADCQFEFYQDGKKVDEH
jgi:hypothetical protein